MISERRQSNLIWRLLLTCAAMRHSPVSPILLHAFRVESSPVKLSIRRATQGLCLKAFSVLPSPLMGRHSLDPGCGPPCCPKAVAAVHNRMIIDKNRPLTLTTYHLLYEATVCSCNCTLWIAGRAAIAVVSKTGCFDNEPFWDGFSIFTKVSVIRRCRKLAPSVCLFWCQ